MISPIRFLFQPARAAVGIKDSPRWLGAFVVLAITAIVIEHFLRPFTLEALFRHLPPTVTPLDRATLRRNLSDGELVRLSFLPVRLMTGWMVFALLLYMVSRIMVPYEPLRFLHVLSLEVHAEVANVLGRLATLVAFSMIPAQAGSDTFSVLSGRTFVSSNDFIFSAFLDSVNLFSLLYILLLANGLAVVCKTGKWKALGIVTVVWTVSAVLNVAFLVLMKEEFHFVI
jgi:hypothetical protein